MKKKIKNSLRKDTTNNNVNTERKDRLKKEVVPNPESPPAISPYTSMSTGRVGMQCRRQYLQPAQQGYAAAAPVHLGASAGYQ